MTGAQRTGGGPAVTWRSSARAGLLIAACAVSLGCYNYLPVSAPSPDPGTYVSVTLTDSGSFELARYLGPSVGVVRGRIFRAGERDLSLSVDAVQLHRGDEIDWKGERVTIARTMIAGLAERRLSPIRTGVMAGASVAAVVALYAGFRTGGFGVFNGGGGGGSR